MKVSKKTSYMISLLIFAIIISAMSEYYLISKFFAIILISIFIYAILSKEKKKAKTLNANSKVESKEQAHSKPFRPHHSVGKDPISSKKVSSYEIRRQNEMENSIVSGNINLITEGIESRKTFPKDHSEPSGVPKKKYEQYSEEPSHPWSSSDDSSNGSSSSYSNSSESSSSSSSSSSYDSSSSSSYSD